MKFEQKAAVEHGAAERQKGNAQWWTDQTMSYDWKDPVQLQRFSPNWFDEIDRRFVFASRLFTDRRRPFEDLMRTDRLSGARVLEIGCGMGFHSELLARSGARLSSIDLSPTSVEATRARFQLKALEGDIRQGDAEQLPFDAASFDFVWSWGVIHHSASTSRALREIRRVLKPQGRAGIMVYSLDGLPAYLTMVGRYAAGFWRGRTLDELLWKASDGFSARYYTRDQWCDLCALFFEVEEFRLCGQDADVMPVPRQIRQPLLRLIPPERQRRLAARRGSMLFTRLKAI